MDSAASSSRTDAGAALEPLRERAERLVRAGDLVAADVAYGELFCAAVQAGALRTLLLALRRQAHLRRRRQLHDEAEELAELARQIAERGPVRDELAWAFNALAAIRHDRNDLAAARAFYQQALELARELDEQRLVAFASQNLGIVDTTCGATASARAHFLESIAAALRIDDSATPIYAHNNLGLMCRDEGEWLEARWFFELGLEAAERLHEQSLEVSLRVNLAEVLIHMGELDAARETLERVTTLATRSGNARALADAERHRALMCRLAGDLEQAERHTLASLRHAEGAGLRLEYGEGLEALGAIRREQGRLALAASAYRQAHETFGSLSAEAYAARAQRALEDLESAAAAH